MSVISAIFKTFSSHPSDPAAPGHLPSEGRPGVLRLSAGPLGAKKDEAPLQKSCKMQEETGFVASATVRSVMMGAFQLEIYQNLKRLPLVDGRKKEGISRMFLTTCRGISV